jgi:hypothetical protein
MWRTRASNIQSKVDRSTQTSRVSSKGHWVCTCMPDTHYQVLCIKSNPCHTIANRNLCPLLGYGHYYEPIMILIFFIGQGRDD